MASFWDQLTGSAASDAANAAAQDTYAKQQRAISDLYAAGDQYASQYRDLAQGYSPYVQTGTISNNLLQQLLTDPSSLRSLPGYQFALDQGTKAVENSAAARSGVQNGTTLKALQQYGTNYADTTYGNQLQRLMGLNQQGLGATQAQVNTTGQGLTGQLGTRTTGFGGAMNAANTIGLGQIAGANAEAAGAQNLLNTGLKLGGMALGGGGGSSFLGQSSFGGPSGNWVDPDSGLSRLMRMAA